MKKTIFFNPSYLLSYSCCRVEKNESNSLTRLFDSCKNGLLLVFSFFLLLLSANTFAQNPGASLSQGENGPLTGILDPMAWRNGNLNAQQSHYIEGHSIPYRLVMINMPLNQEVTLTLGYDLVNGGKYALDFITDYRQLQPHGFANHPNEEVVNPLLPDPLIAPTSTMPVSMPSYLLPANDNISGVANARNEFLALQGAGETILSIWGANFNQVHGVTYQYFQNSNSITAAEVLNISGNDKEVQFTIKFTPTSNTVTLAWGGHIALRQDWGINPILSAGGINGSPYHMRTIDWSIGNLGNQDRSLQIALSAPICPSDYPTPLSLCRDAANTTNLASCPDSVCAGSTQYFGVPTESGATSYQWTLLSNTAGATFVGSYTSQNVAVTATNLGNYVIKVEMTNASGVVTICEQLIKVIPTDCSIKGPETVCTGATGTVYTANPGEGNQYAWTISGSGTIVGSNNQQQVTVNAGISCNSTYTLTLTITNTAGCVTTCTKVVTIADNENPVLGDVLGNITVQCGNVPAPPVVTATDNCGWTVVKFEESVIPGECTGVSLIRREWTAVDRCGNSDEHVQLITVVDTIAPVISGVGPNGTIECSSEPIFSNPTAVDNCGGNVMLTFADVSTVNDCGLGTITRTWTAKDCSLNASTASQTITFVDTVNPTLVPIADYTLTGCNAPWPTVLTTTWSDNCAPGGTITATVGEVATKGCIQTRAYFFTATDCAGNFVNSTTTVTRTYDETAPTIAAIANYSLQGCNTDWPTLSTTWTDNCSEGGSITATAGEVTTNGCLQSRVYTFTVTDACNNTSTSITTVTRTYDVTAPTIAAIANYSLQGCNMEWPTLTTTWTDNCSTGGSITATTGEVTTNGCLQSRVYTFTVTDACGNTSSSTTTVTRTYDVTSSTIAAIADYSLQGCNMEWPTLSTTWTDNCSTGGSITATAGEVTTNGCLQSRVYTFTVTDACGNTSSSTTTVTRTYDVTLPTIAAIANYSLQGCNTDWPTLTTTWTDNCSTGGSITATAGEVTTNGCLQSRVYTFTVTDACGNTSSSTTTVTRTYDVTLPTIAAIADYSLQGCNMEWPTLTTTWTDNCSTGGSITATAGEVITNGCLQSRVYTFTVTDACGNTSSSTTTVTRTYDVTLPTIAAIANYSLQGCNMEWPTLSTTWTDNCSTGGSITATAGEVTTNGCLQSRVYIFTVTDACGNTSSSTTTVTRTYDVTLPTIAAIADYSLQGCNMEWPTLTTTWTDNCSTGGSITATAGEVITNGCLQSRVYTFTVTDACGNTSSSTTTITRTYDVTLPTIAAIADYSLQGCNMEWPTLTTTWTDNCSTGGSITATAGEVTTNGCLQSRVYTFTVTDACGNTSSSTTTVTRTYDVTAPVFEALPSASSIQCPAAPVFAQAVANDNCGTPVTLTFVDQTTPGVCAGTYTVTRTWTAVDGCGNSSSASQTISVIDTVAPVFVETLPANATVQCVAPAPAVLTAIDNCGTATVTFSEQVTPGECPVLSQVIRTWTATDACGNSVTHTQKIIVEDTIAPTFVGTLPPNSLTVECDAIPTPEVLTAVDNCGDATVLFFEVIIPGDCAGNYIIDRLWKATDGCKNFIIHKQIITVIDTTDPVIAGVGASYTVECPTEAVFSIPSATDNCDNNVSLTFVDNSNLDNCGLGTVTRTWTATDDCGNTVSASQTITIEDTTAPVIAGVGPAYTVECPTAAVFSMPTASDTCDSTVTFGYVDSSDLDNCGLGTKTRTWTATDCAGNTVSASQTITIEDTTAPVIAGVGAAYTVECPTAAVFSMPTASDTCDSTVTFGYVDSSDLDNCGLGTKTRTWTATDCAGNTVSASQTITIEDTTAPVIAGVGAAYTVECPTAAVFSMPTASDTCDSTVTFGFVDSSDLDNCGLGTKTRTWTATDCAGNTVSASQTITIEDTTAPVIAGVGPAYTVECPTAAVFSMPTASDTCDSTVTFGYVDSSDLDNCGLGTKTRTWTATDCAGNTVSASQTITIEDTTAPVIAGVGPAYTVECPTAAVFSMPTASDTCDSTVTFGFVDSSDLDNCGLGTKTRTWTATDCAGNTVSASQTITIEDTTAPVIAGVGAAYTVECPTAAVFSMPTASDTCDSTVTFGFVDSSDLDNCGLGTKTRTWTATDCAGNTVSASQTITIEDTTAPVIAGVGPAYTVECPTAAVFSMPTASDTCDSTVTFGFVDSSDLDNCGLGTKTRTWTATDCAGNTVSASQTITIEDTTAPVIAGVGPAYTVECPTAAVFSMPTASDTCDSTVTFGYVDSSDLDNCGLGTKTRTWTATDCAGNTVSASQTITIEDTTAPVIAGVGAAYTVECPTAAVFSMPTASDTCDSTVTFGFVDSSDLDNCGLGTKTRTWTATDCAGNTVSASQTITIEDTTAPVIAGVGAAYTVECPTAAVFSMPTASDTCDSTVTFGFVDSSDLDNCGLGTKTRTWTATDCAGNTVSASQTITIEDTTAPVIAGVGPAYTVECPTAAVFSMPTASDTCDSTVTFGFVDSSDLDNCGLGTKTRTWTATDCAGNTVSASQTITIEDTTAPVFVETLPLNTSVQCIAPAPAVLTATDACGGNITVIFSEQVTPGECPVLSQVIRTWTATDCAGNSVSHTQKIIVEDTIAPTFVGTLPPSSLIVECDAIPTPEVLTAIDNCGSASVLFFEAIIEGDCAGSYTIDRLWKATDGCKNFIIHKQIITVIDTTDPVFVGQLPGDVSVECDAVPAPAVLTATDSCGDATVVYSQTREDGDCDSEYVLTRTWVATDDCGNDISHTQVITVQDNTLPDFVGDLPQNKTVQCDAVNEPEVLSAIDNCGTADVTYNQVRVDGNCPGNYELTRTWTAIDECGNVRIHVQTITVIDTTPPVFNGSGPSIQSVQSSALPQDMTVECDNVPVAEELTATDNCGIATVVYSQTRTDGNCPSNYTLTRVWTATDECNNVTTHIQVITVQDSTAPVIAGVGAAYTVECPTTAVFSMPTASDVCDEEVSLTYVDSNTLNDCGLGTVTRTWTATDCAGNTVSASQTITIEDTTAPVIAGVGPAYTVECPTAAVFSMPTASDTCDSTVTFGFVDSSDLDNCGLGTKTRTWTATDCAGNTVSASQTITIEDTTAPVIAGVGAAYTVECPTAAVFSMPTASDTCDSTVTFGYVDSSDLDNCGLGTKTRTWTATDCAGNTVSASQTITIEDTTAPVIAGVGAAYTVECPTAAVFSMPTASDTCDSTVTFGFVDSSDLDNCGLGTKTRTWTATDCAGNTVSASQTITIEDTTAPVIAGVGPAYTVECPTAAVFSMPTASDTCDSTVTFGYVDSSDLDNCGLGTKTRTWTATDCAGNTVSASQTITIEDTTAPVIAGVGPAYTVECPTAAVFSMPTASDTCDSTVTFGFVDSSDLDNCGLGTKTRTWTATDCAGNTVSASQTITIEDTTAPVIAGVGAAYTVECPTAAVFSMPTASDTCDSTVTFGFVDSSDLDNCGLGTKTRTWTATDCAGNTVSASQTITIEDTTAPVIAGVGPAYTVECPTAAVFSMPTASDACDSTVTFGFVDSSDLDDCGLGTKTRTWTATDCAGNTVSASQTITIEDTTAPVVTSASNMSVDCDGSGNLDDLATWLASNGGATASDACSGDVTWTDNFDGFEGICGSVTVIFTATDCAGNSANTSATFTINTQPIVISCPMNVTPICDTDFEGQFAAWIAGFTYSGGCGALTATDLSGYMMPAAGQTLTITFEVTDECGSIATCTASFTTPECFDGCTIGYWKNHTNRWCPSYSPSMLYGSVFTSAPNGLANKTLLQVLNLGGGGVNNLGRQSVAALLNICHPDVNYPTPYTTIQSLVNAVNAAFQAGGNGPAGALASQLDALNNTGCPLGGTSATSASRVAESMFDVYPVPFNGELTIRYDFDYISDVTIEFFDLKGLLIKTIHDSNSYYKKEMKIDVQFLRESSQIYFVKVTTSRGTEMKKIISGIK